MADPAGAVARLALNNVVVQRGERTVLRVGHLDLGAGEVLAILGPNGAGKSTLLQVCGFLLRPDHGYLCLDGQIVRGTPLAARRHATMLLQQPVLFRGTVQRNVELGLRLHGVQSSQRRARANSWLERFGVHEVAGRQARTLSGGEAQRVALARALALEPEIVLLDEPFTSLDQPTREALVSTTIVELRRLRCTTIFVTHDRQEALTLSDRVLVLVDGRVRALGTPGSLLARPADALVAAFIGADLPGLAIGPAGDTPWPATLGDANPPLALR